MNMQQSAEAQPARPQTVHSDVLVPAAWSLVAGVLLGGAAGVVALDNGWQMPGKWALIVGGLALLVGFFSYSAAIRATWWSSKEHSQSEGDAPAPAQETRWIERPPVLTRRNSGSAPAKRAVGPAISFAEFVRGCAYGTSEERWAGFIDAMQMEAWRDALIEAGWAKWRSRERRHGWTLTATADEVLASMQEPAAGERVFESFVQWLGHGW